MVAKKTETVETFTQKKAEELKEGDRFRVPGSTAPWQQIVFLEIKDSNFYDAEFNTKKQIVFCKTKIEGTFEEFPFTAFTNVSVEVLDG